MARRKNTAECYEVLLRIARRQAEERRKQEEKARRREKDFESEGGYGKGAANAPSTRLDGVAGRAGDRDPSARAADARVFDAVASGNPALAESFRFPGARGPTPLLRPPRASRSGSASSTGAPDRVFGEHPSAETHAVVVRRAGVRCIEHPSGARVWAGDASGRAGGPSSVRADRPILAAARREADGTASSVRAPWLEPEADSDTPRGRGGPAATGGASSRDSGRSRREASPRSAEPPRGVGPLEAGEPIEPGESVEDSGDARADSAARGEGSARSGVLDLEARGGRRFAQAPRQRARRERGKPPVPPSPVEEPADRDPETRTSRGAPGARSAFGAGLVTDVGDTLASRDSSDRQDAQDPDREDPGCEDPRIPGAESPAREDPGRGVRKEASEVRGGSGSSDCEAEPATPDARARTPFRRAVALVLQSLRWLFGPASSRLLERRVTLRLSTLLIIVLSEAIFLGLIGFWIQTRPKSSTSALHSRLFDEREAADRDAAAAGALGAADGLAGAEEAGSGRESISDPDLLTRPAWGRRDATPRQAPAALERLPSGVPAAGAKSDPPAASEPSPTADETLKERDDSAGGGDVHWIRVRAMMDRKECVELLEHLARLRESLEAAGGCGPGTLACKEIESEMTKRDGVELYHVDIGPFASYRDSQAAEEELRDRTSRPPHVFKGKTQYFRKAYSRKRD